LFQNVCKKTNKLELNTFVRTEGKPMLSMFAMMASALTNIVLDYIFIGIFDMGVKGAAYATFITTLGTSVAMTFMNRGLAEYG
jgi:Na+-driven multidrug efflux pump